MSRALPLFAIFPAVVLALLALGRLEAQTLTDASLQVQTIVAQGSGLSQPTGMRFLGDSPSDFFVIEKASGAVKRYLNGAATTVLELPVNSSSERGLLGIELHFNFGVSGAANNDKVYLYYSRANGEGNWVENRLSRFSWNGSALVGEQVLGVFGTSSDGLATGPNHDGGPLRFGPDGKLYGITGDLNRSRAEQNNQSQQANSAMVGGVYRLNDEGSVPADNPFTAHTNADFHRWFAYGIRNSFGLAFDPANGSLWDTENGPSEYDEVNLVARGFNSGWTDIMGPDARSSGNVSGLVTLGPAAAYSDPEFSWLSPVAVTAIHFPHGSDLGTAYDNRALVGDANLGNLYSFTLNAARDAFVLSGDLADLVADSSAERNQVRIGQGFGVVTDLERGPDGNVYLVDLTGRIFRISPKLVLGDFNRNLQLDTLDIAAMLEALVNLDAYQSQSRLSDVNLLALGDINGDGAITNTDIQSLLNLLGGGAQSVPEPAAWLMAVMGFVALARQSGSRLAKHAC